MTCILQIVLVTSLAFFNIKKFPPLHRPFSIYKTNSLLIPFIDILDFPHLYIFFFFNFILLLHSAIVETVLS